MASRNSNAKGRRIKGTFLMLPHAVLASDAYTDLSAAAVKLLVDIGQQYLGANNGNLDICFSRMARIGWRSKATLNRARVELLESGLIEQTRQGGMNMGPNLYALTWHRIDECKDPKTGKPKHDVKATSTPSSLWKNTGLTDEN